MADRDFRAFQYPPFVRFGDILAMIKLSAKPRIRRIDTFTIPTIEEVAHEDEGRLCLKSVLLATEIRQPHVEAAFDADTVSFTFSVKLSNSRSASGIVVVGPACKDHSHFI